jgi:hypothetical protein
MNLPDAVKEFIGFLKEDKPHFKSLKKAIGCELVEE